MQPGAERQLAAIMFTDIVGYTALTERDEVAAIRVRDRHRALVSSLVEQFRGELIDATGDESLSIFSSALLAVDCALAIQAALRDDPELEIRIGIHLGDLLRRGAEVLGEGVNLAARIRPLAEPGGICISEPVHQLVRHRSHIHSQALGPQSFKNVTEPVAVFSVVAGGEREESRSPLRQVGRIAAGIAATLVLAYAAYVPNRTYVLSSLALTLPRLIGSPIEQTLGFATTSDDVRIAYATTGEGPALVFVLGWATHLERGFGSPLYDPEGWIRRNSEQRMLVRYDGRGFGLSDRDVDDFSAEARIRDLEAVVDTLGLERFAIYAISAGGPAAVTYAARNPDRVSHLILAGTLAGGMLDKSTAEEQERWKGMIALFRTSWDSPIVRSMMVEFLAPDADEVERRVVSEFLRISGDGPAVAGFMSEMMKIDARADASRLRVPALVIHGQKDPVFLLEFGAELARLIPAARFEILAGADHRLGTVDSPRIPVLIDAFLAEAPESAR